MNLSQREKAFEDMYAHDKELHFKIRARRNKQAGLWAATKMGKNAEAANAYALELVTAFLERQALFLKLKADFAASGINLTDAEISAKINELVDESRNHFMSDLS